SEVAYHVNECRMFGHCAIVFLIDSVVFVLQIPVIYQRHHYPQSIELACAGEGVPSPLPLSDLLFSLRMPLQPHVTYGAIRPHQLLTAMQTARWVFDANFREEVILIREVADGPYQPRSHCFGPRLAAELDFPLHPIPVPNDEFGI